MPDIERAKRQGNLRGDPMIAESRCETKTDSEGRVCFAFYSLPSGYKKEEIIDYICLACDRSFAAHDEYSECWRVLKSDEELRQYDEAQAICDRIRG